MAQGLQLQTGLLRQILEQQGGAARPGTMLYGPGPPAVVAAVMAEAAGPGVLPPGLAGGPLGA
eukprot:8168662-Lingulodinium_polyedra.AAC.1